jgi:hypothetical protein
MTDFKQPGWDISGGELPIDPRLSDEAIYQAVDFWTDPRFRKDKYDPWIMNKFREAIRRALAWEPDTAAADTRKAVPCQRNRLTLEQPLCEHEDCRALSAPIVPAIIPQEDI